MLVNFVIAADLAESSAATSGGERAQRVSFPGIPIGQGRQEVENQIKNPAESFTSTPVQIAFGQKAVPGRDNHLAPY